MIHYHGGRHSSAEMAVRLWSRRHALVSFADGGQVEIAADVSQSFALDNGAFSVWRKGITVDWRDYYAWVDKWRRHPGFDWALIPDVIEGDEGQNDELLAEWPYEFRGVPVWHYHENMDRLDRLVRSYPLVALGSSGEWPTPGTARWWQRTEQAMRVCCDNAGRPMTSIHGLRMLRNDIVQYCPFRSADSAGASRGAGTERNFPRNGSLSAKALYLADCYESQNSPATWAGIPKQEALFA